MNSKEITSWHCGKKKEFEPIKDIFFKLNSSVKQLQDLRVEDILQVFEQLSAKLLDRTNPLLKKYPNSGIPFLGAWCTSENIRNILNNSFNSLEELDQFVVTKNSESFQMRAYPKGVIVHWIAGNVPTLGLLSLVSGLLTKNGNLIRIPSKSNDLLIDLVSDIYSLGEHGRRIAEAVSIIRYDYSDENIAHEISRNADVRIVWGGNDSCEAIKKLPCKITCTDLFFPDRTSFAVLGKSVLENEEKASTAARLLAHDASVFEQKACASPHTVFLNTSDDCIVSEFCIKLKKEMSNALKFINKVTPSEKEVMAILNLRAQYDMFYDAYYSEGSEFSIFTDDKVQLGPSIGNRTLFVRKLPPLSDLAKIIPENIQSVGMQASGNEYEVLTRILGEAGVHRIVPLGAMTHFAIPWDGLMIPQYLVRWTTRNS